MLTADGPKVIEFNVRFGDPEAQVVLPMLDEDLSWLLGAAATGALPSRPARFRHEPHVGVVLAAGGYPDSPEAGKPIDGLDAASDVPGCDRLSRRDQQARWPARDGRRSRADGRRPRHDVSRGDRHGVCRGVAHSLRRDAVPARHRAEGVQCRSMKYSVVTFGCRVNQADSLAIEGALRARGAISASPDEADLVVVNTCSVTATADQGARQTIRRIARSNPDVQIVVTGCYATRRPDDLRDLPNVAHLVPNDRKDDLLDVSGASLPLTTAMRFGDGDGPCGAPLEPGVAGRTAFTLRVQTGCDERCSYCIIPSTRGRSRSRPLAEIAAPDRAGRGRGLQGNRHHRSASRFVRAGPAGGLVAGRARAPSGDWQDDVLFRISSLEPMDCTDEIVELVAGSPRLAPHFHLPLQHGDDDVLRA